MQYFLDSRDISVYNDTSQKHKETDMAQLTHMAQTFKERFEHSLDVLAEIFL